MRINPMTKILPLLMVVLLTTACGGIQTRVLSDPAGDLRAQPVTVLDSDVTSKEQYPNALEENKRWKAISERKLAALMSRKRIATGPDANRTVQAVLKVTYGNRALRYWVGFGAGSGHISVTISMRDAAGNTLYSVESAGKLSVGAFGGSMESVIESAIDAAIKEFEAELG